MSEWLLLPHGKLVYLFLFLALLGGAVGLPIPEDLPLIASGVLVQKGLADVKVAFAVCYSAILIGDIGIYYVGHRFGPSLFNTALFRKKMPPSRVAKINREISRYGALIIFIARHIFYLRTATFLTCGAFGMSFTKFLVVDALAALISAPLMMWLGYIAADHLDYLLHLIKRAKVASILIFLASLILVYLFFRRRGRDEPEASASLPLATEED